MVDDNDDTTEEETDPVVEHVEEELDTGKTLTMDHLNEMKKQLDARLDSLSRDKTKDDEEKSELRGQIDTLSKHVKELTEKLEEKKEQGGETMLIAPEELNPKQQNDGVEEDHTGDGPPPREPRKGWKRWV